MFLLLLLFFLSFTHGEILARINDRVITSEEFNAFFNTYWKQILHINGKKATLEDRKHFFFEYLRGIIVEKIAEDMGIEVEEREVKDRLKIWGIRNAPKPLIDMIRREVILEKITEKITEGVKVSDREVEAYYLLNRREFYYPDQIKLLRVIAQDRKSALKAYEILKRGGKPEGVTIGRERWYSLQALPKIVRRKLYPYRVGKVSRPIALETGYLILKITDKRKVGYLPLSEVRERVRESLLSMKKQEVLKEWFKEVLKGLKLEIYLQNLQ